MNTIPKPEHAQPNDYAWPYVIRDFISTLTAAGFTLSLVDDGEERHKRPTEESAIETICSVDDSTLYVKKEEESPIWISIVLGNEPCETVSDYALRDTAVGKELDKLITDWGNKWEGIRCPTWKEMNFWIEAMK